MKTQKFRIKIIFFLIILLCFSLTFRLFNLQIKKGDYFLSIARKQREIKKDLPGKRGDIYDREDKLLTSNLILYSVVAEPYKIEDKRRVAKELSRILQIDEKELLYRLYTRYFFAHVKRKVSDGIVKEIKSLNIKGIEFIPESKRFYPNGAVACHLLGFCGVDSQGLSGIELSYDKYLKGKDGFFKTEFDARGLRKGLPIPVSYVREKEPEDGYDIFLTLDMNLQYLAEREAEETYNKWRAKGVTILMMNPKSGEILAAANRPVFDPNNFNKFREKDWKNPIISMVYEPGSTFKIFLIAAGLEEGIIKKKSKFYCGGELKMYDIPLHDAEESEAHGWLDIPGVLKHSCNICAAQIGLKIGKDKFCKYIKDFGFGNKTGVDLPAEEKGIFRPKTWGEVDISRVSFGQGIAATPIQLLSGVCCIANGGILMQPYLVKEIRNSQGEIVKRFFPHIVRKVISQNTAKEITQYMVGVVEEGTGKLVKIEGYSVAGKTGTSQKSFGRLGYQKRYISSFCGFIPAYFPKIAILVIIDEPKGEYFASRVAAPVFKKLAEESIYYLEGE